MEKALTFILTVFISFSAWGQETMMKSTKMGTDGAMMKATPLDSTAFDLRGLGNQVVAFTTEKDAWMLAKTQTVVYFFAATWCPTCQATYKDIQANLTRLPKGFTLVFVNYDKAADLKQKYGITSQHTFVLVGPAGEKKKVWSGTTTVADLVAQTKSM